MALVSNDGSENGAAAPAESDLKGIIDESKAALASADSSPKPIKKKKGRPSNAEKAAAELAANPPPAPFEPKPAGLAPLLFEGVKSASEAYCADHRVPECVIADEKASTVADHLDLAIGCAVPDMANSRWGTCFASLILAAVVIASHRREVLNAEKVKKAAEFRATQDSKTGVFSVPPVSGAAESAPIQTTL